MHRLGRYESGDSMSGLVNDDYRILLVMSRFDISIGFGDKTIGEVCADSGVDTPTFLAVANMLFEEESDAPVADGSVSVEALLRYLHNSHDYFLDFRLPAIRAKLFEALGQKKNDLSKAIMYYFDEYVGEVGKHMTYEEKTVFPYVHALLRGEKKDGYSIDVFRKQHDQVEARLSEFKNIIIRYYTADNANEINSILFDIFNCEQDLAFHNAVEDRLFVPLVVGLESGKKRKAQ